MTLADGIVFGFWAAVLALACGRAFVRAYRRHPDNRLVRLIESVRRAVADEEPLPPRNGS